MAKYVTLRLTENQLRCFVKTMNNWKEIVWAGNKMEGRRTAIDARRRAKAKLRWVAEAGGRLGELTAYESRELSRLVNEALEVVDMCRWPSGFGPDITSTWSVVSKLQRMQEAIGPLEKQKKPRSF